jgi:IS605 OrfB family transposase
MIKSTKLSLKFANKRHRDALREFIAEYRRVAVLACDKLWLVEGLPKYPKVETLGIETWLPTSVTGSCCMAVIGVIKGTRESRLSLGNTSTEIPDVSAIEPRLTLRNFKLATSKKSSFDSWLDVRVIKITNKTGRKTPRFPLKSTRHNNKLASQGRLMNSIQLSNETVTLSYEIPDTPKVETGETIGIDIGMDNMVARNDIGIVELKHPHGWTQQKIITRLMNQKPGSHNYRQTQALRVNYTNWFINQLDLTGIKVIKLENIYDLNRGKKKRKRKIHWSYPLIYHKLETRCAEIGVRVQYINQAYTSQKCSSCGAVDKHSRLYGAFKCTTCGFTEHADVNACQYSGARSDLLATRTRSL